MALDVEDLKVMWLDLRARVDQVACDYERYLDFFEQSPEAYLVTDVAGVIGELNGAAVDILQRRKRHLRGRPLAAMVALDCRPEFRRRLGLLLTGDAQRSWRTVIESPGLRTDVSVTARLIERAAEVGGICWLLQAAP
jgi:PAS domain S-box-containing protein